MLRSIKQTAMQRTCPCAWFEFKRFEVHLVDALAIRGEEGRGRLRKAPGKCQQLLIRRCPNGETHLYEVSLTEYIG